MNNRLSKVKDLIKKQNLDAILVSSTSNIIYLTGFSNFSTVEREAFLFITKKAQYIITDGRYSEAVIDKVKNFKLIELNINNKLTDIFQELAAKHNSQKIGIEENDISVLEYRKLRQCFKTLKNFNLEMIRVIKDKDEITTIEQACAIGDEAFTYITKKIKQGVTEKEIAQKLELFIRKKGAEISFPSIVAFGRNSSIPHHQTSNQILITNNIVLLDFGVKLNNYCSDMTRTFFFGSANEELKKMYQTVLDAQKKALENLKSLILNHKSTKASYLDKVARDHIISQGYQTIPHSVGHGIGIEVHEAPRLSPNSKDELKLGMVFSIEPGVYIPEVGGVRIEDLVVIDSSGPRLLTKSRRSF